MLSLASAFLHHGQSGTASHGLVHWCPAIALCYFTLCISCVASIKVFHYVLKQHFSCKYLNKLKKKTLLQFSVNLSFIGLPLEVVSPLQSFQSSILLQLLNLYSSYTNDNEPPWAWCGPYNRHPPPPWSPEADHNQLRILVCNNHIYHFVSFCK